MNRRGRFLELYHTFEGEDSDMPLEFSMGECIEKGFITVISKGNWKDNNDVVDQYKRDLIGLTWDEWLIREGRDSDDYW